MTAEPHIRPVERRGARFRVEIGDRNEAVFWRKFETWWEEETLSAFDAILGPGARLLDIGGWIGPTALYAAARGAAVTIFEPDPVAFARLTANLALNPELAARITPLPRAVSRETGPATLYSKHLGDSMSSLLPRGGQSCRIERESILGADFGRLLRGADLVKIDIEGGEFDLLPALRPQIFALRPTVLLSLHAFFLPDAPESAKAPRPDGWIAQQDRLIEAVGDYPYVYRPVRHRDSFAGWARLEDPPAALPALARGEGLSGSLLLSAAPLAL